MNPVWTRQKRANQARQERQKHAGLERAACLPPSAINKSGSACVARPSPITCSQPVVCAAGEGSQRATKQQLRLGLPSGTDHARQPRPSHRTPSWVRCSFTKQAARDAWKMLRKGKKGAREWECRKARACEVSCRSFTSRSSPVYLPAD